MPVRTGYKIPISLSQDGDTISNVRNKTLVDYAKPSRTWTIDSGSVSSQPTGNGTWGQTLPNCIETSINSIISTPVLLASYVAPFTVMMRVRIPVLATPGGYNFSYFYIHGDFAGLGEERFYLFYSYSPITAIHYLRCESASSGTITYSESVVANTWYHLVLVNNGSKFLGYLDGGYVAQVANNTAKDYTGNSELCSRNDTIIDLTDFVFLKKALSATEIANYAAAPFI